MRGINYCPAFLILKSIAMQKQIIGLLLLAAAGTGAYFYFSGKKSNEPSAVKLNKELLIGKWKTETIEPATDSTESKYMYDFKNDGKVLRSANDTTKADTIFYNWNKTAALVLTKLVNDSTGSELVVTKLNADTLQWLTAAKTTVTLLKLKDK
jgi:hypothetical protein